MPSSRPVSSDLLAVVREYLKRDLSPLVPEYHQFQLRIVDRLLATVSLEASLGPDADHSEIDRLTRLLEQNDRHADDTQRFESEMRAPARLAELNRQFARSLRAGALRHDDPRVLAHLRETLESSLRINNPKWLAPSGASAPHTETGKPQSS